MSEPSDTRRQVDYEKPCGCAAAPAVDGWKVLDDEEQALARTRLGRLILWLRGLVARALAHLPSSRR